VKNLSDCTVGIVGLGLMGGAFAMALKGKVGRILAYDIDAGVLARAQAEAVIDEGFVEPGAMLSQCKLVFLCLNPATLLAFMDKWMGVFAQNALITDIAGVKSPIVAAMEKTLRPDLDYIPGHPMAGSEKGGYDQAKFCKFADKNYILTPMGSNRPENIAVIKNTISLMGFGRITETTAAEHDRKIAFTSQLCHVIAAALIDCETDLTITRFAGSSFEDLTRIAMLNAPQWTELFLENSGELLARIGQFERSLDKLKSFIAEDRKTDLLECLQSVREKRMAM
jgi:prephenate dehydrogenase